MSSGHQRIKWRSNIAENVNRLSRVHERYRQTTDRRTDGRTTTYSEHEHMSSRSLKTKETSSHVFIPYERPSFPPKFEQISAITSKRYEIECQLVLITNRKSHMSFRMVPTSVTLNDLERVIALIAYCSSQCIQALGVMTLRYKNNVLRLIHLSIIFQIELFVCGTNCRIVLLKLQHVLYLDG